MRASLINQSTEASWRAAVVDTFSFVVVVVVFVVDFVGCFGLVEMVLLRESWNMTEYIHSIPMKSLHVIFIEKCAKLISSTQDSLDNRQTRLIVRWNHFKKFHVTIACSRAFDLCETLKTFAKVFSRTFCPRNENSHQSMAFDVMVRNYCCYMAMADRRRQWANVHCLLHLCSARSAAALHYY